MSFNKGSESKREAEKAAYELEREGKTEQAKAKFLEIFERFRNTMPLNEASYFVFKAQERSTPDEDVNRRIAAARSWLKAKYLDTFERERDAHLTNSAAYSIFRVGEYSAPDEAVGYFITASDLWLKSRDFQQALRALEHAERCSDCAAKPEEVAMIKERRATVKKEMPHNLEECFIELETHLAPDQIQAFKEMKNTLDLAKYHMSLGRWIRNTWGLWAGSELSETLCKMGCSNADDMSLKILQEFHRHLKARTLASGDAKTTLNK